MPASKSTQTPLTEMVGKTTTIDKVPENKTSRGIFGKVQLFTKMESIYS